ncbi:MAG: hypothetical protein ACPLX8_01380 [Nanopusillaceae archaeon]
MFIYNIIPKELYSYIRNYINELETKIDKVYVYVDVQNHSAAFTDEGIDLYTNGSTFKDLFNEILYHITSITKNFKEIGLASHVFLYTDRHRNLFNSNMLSDWKLSRKKELSEFPNMSEKDYLERDSNVYMNKFIKTGLKALSHLTNITYNASIVVLENMDSDFFPALIINKTKSKDNILHILVSNDHDYIHLIDNPNIVRYSRSYKRYYENYPLLETVYNRSLFLKKSLDIKDTDTAKFIANYYQIFHALSGDQTDDIKPLVPKMSYKTWAKKLKFNDPVYDVIDKIINNDIQIENVNNEDILARLVIFDFNITSELILGLLDESKLTERSKKIMNFLISKYPQNVVILKTNCKILEENIFNQRYMIDDCEYILDSFAIRRDYKFYLW